jgi:hypothetical protein
MRTVICHFFNEEYLLPWWLKHHLPLFDHGILIDHGSTDNSARICKELAPGWRLVRSRLTEFDAYLNDFEVMEYERDIPGWKIALNVTEFLMTSAPLDAIEKYLTLQGRTGCCASGMLIVDEQPNTEPNPDISLPLQKHFGIDDNAVTDIARRTQLGIASTPMRNRFYHCNPVGMYYPGRHGSFHPDSKFRLANLMIFQYGYAPWNEHTLKRKMQIANKLPISDLNRGWGGHHLRGVEQLEQDYVNIKLGAMNLLEHEQVNSAILLCCGATTSEATKT